MSELALTILRAVYEAYDKGEDYNVNTPSGGEIHTYNMALKEIMEYIEFKRRDMIKISMTLTDKGLEFAMENF